MVEVSWTSYLDINYWKAQYQEKSKAPRGGWYDARAMVCEAEETGQQDNRSTDQQENRTTGKQVKRPVSVKTNFGRAEQSSVFAFFDGFIKGAAATASGLTACGYIANEIFNGANPPKDTADAFSLAETKEDSSPRTGDSFPRTDDGTRRRGDAFTDIIETVIDVFKEDEIGGKDTQDAIDTPDAIETFDIKPDIIPEIDIAPETETYIEVDTDGDGEVDATYPKDEIDSGKDEYDAGLNICKNPPNKFSVLLPQDKAQKLDPTKPIQFKWENNGDPDSVYGDKVTYCVSVADNETFANPIIGKCGLDAAQYQSDPNALGKDKTYYFQATAQDACPEPNLLKSNITSFTTSGYCDNGPTAPSITYPNGQTNVSGTPKISWNASTDLDIVKYGDKLNYCVYVSQDQTFKSTEINACIGDASEYQVPASTLLLFNTQYYAKVCAKDMCSAPKGNEACSGVVSFKTLKPAGPCDHSPNAGNLILPSDGQTGVPFAVKFSWDGATDVDPQDNIKYRLVVSGKNDLSNPIVDINGITQTEKSVDLANAQYSTPYYWTVEPYDSCNNKAGNLPVYSFTTKLAPVCDNPPNKPTMTMAQLKSVDPKNAKFQIANNGDIDQGDSVNMCLSVSCNGAAIVNNQCGVKAGEYSIDPSSLAPEMKCEVIVKAYDSCLPKPNMAQSDPLQFSTISACDNPPVQSIILSPNNNAVGLPTDQTMTWSIGGDQDFATVGDTVSTCLNVYEKNNPSNVPFTKCGLSSDKQFVNGLSYNTAYCAQIEDSDACKPVPNKTKSAPACFTTKASAYCNNPPTDFTLASPADKAQNIDPANVLLKWNPSDASKDPGDKAAYQVLVCNTQDCAKPIINQMNVSANVYGVPAQTLSYSEKGKAPVSYWWQVVASDLCNQTKASPVYSFTTKLIPECDNPPEPVAITSIKDGQTWVPLTPTIEWTQPIDKDPGGKVADVCLDVNTAANFSAPAVFTQCNLTGANKFTIGSGILDYGKTYYTRIRAKDSCANESAGQPVGFSTEKKCIPGTFTDTDFTGGVKTDTVATNGTLSVAEDSSAWTYKYEASSGLMPEAAGWTMTAPAGWAVKEFLNSVLHVSTMGKDDDGYFERPTSFSHANGWVTEGRVKGGAIDESLSTAHRTLGTFDGVKAFYLMIRNDKIWEGFSKLEYQMDTSSDFHVYKVAAKGNDFKVYVDGI
ncbi:hypothetical protein HZC34_03000, partial [Candidatus Saganbacteria bacterium]|nr:hypothetical protein [Candidatus Saganbacteria bacterium]